MRVSSRHIAVDGDSVTPPLPVLTLEAAAGGPCVVVTANIHGDELTGLGAAWALVHQLPQVMVAGRVVIFPSLNPAGLASGSRTVPADGTDLNRIFPGRRRGRAAERQADLIWREVNGAHPDVVVDLHADSVFAIPYALLDRPVSLGGPDVLRMQGKLQDLGDATGLTVVHEYPRELYLRYGLERSLAGAMVNRSGVPAVTIEAGPRRVMDPASVDVVVAAVLGVLQHVGLVAPGSASTGTPGGGPWRRAPGPRTTVAGVWQPEREAGSVVQQGDVLGRVRHLDGRVLEVLKSPSDGLVLSWTEAVWSAAGTVVGTLGVEERG